MDWKPCPYCGGPQTPDPDWPDAPYCETCVAGTPRRRVTLRMLGESRSEIADLRAQVAQLTAERDEYKQGRQHWKAMRGEMADEAEAQKQRADKAEKRLAAVMEPVEDWEQSDTYGPSWKLAARIIRRAAGREDA